MDEAVQKVVGELEAIEAAAEDVLTDKQQVRETLPGKFHGEFFGRYVSKTDMCECVTKCRRIAVELYSWFIDNLYAHSFNPAAAGPLRHPPVAGGGHIVAPPYFCDDIVATRKDREAQLFTHLPEYLAEVLYKFGVDPI